MLPLSFQQQEQLINSSKHMSKKDNRIKLHTTCRKPIVYSKSEQKQKQEGRVGGIEY